MQEGNENITALRLENQETAGILGYVRYISHAKQGPVLQTPFFKMYTYSKSICLL